MRGITPRIERFFIRRFLVHPASSFPKRFLLRQKVSGQYADFVRSVAKAVSF